MAVTDPSGQERTKSAVPVSIDKVVDGSGDHSDAAVTGKVFFDKSDLKIYEGNGTANAIPMFSAGSSILADNIITVNTLTGDNATGAVGDLSKAFETPEYVVANVNNTGSETGTTASGSPIITAFGDTSDFEVGQVITATGVPDRAFLISKTATTVTIDKDCTASASVTITWYTRYLIKTFGPVSLTSQIRKEGFEYDFGNSFVTWGNMTVFEMSAARVTPEYVVGGIWSGTHANSNLIEDNPLIGVSTIADGWFHIGPYHSIGTGVQFFVRETFKRWNNLSFHCPNFDCEFGSIGNFQATTVRVTGHRYGLLRGEVVVAETYYTDGSIETPQAIEALKVKDARATINANIVGGIRLENSERITVNGSIHGNSITTSNRYATFNGMLDVNTVTASGTTTSIHKLFGSLVCTSGDMDIGTLYGDYTGSNASNCIIQSARGSNDIGWMEAITLTGTAECRVDGGDFSSNTREVFLSVASGCALIINNFLYYKMVSCAGTITFEGGKPIQYEDGAAITGMLIYNNCQLELLRVAVESIGSTPVIIISTGTVVVNGGKIFCDHADSKSALIRKDASGGKLVFTGQPLLRVSNGLAPIQITSNTGTAQDVYDHSFRGNGASGFELADAFTDTDYFGTSFAPNLVVVGLIQEDTSYTE